MHSTPTIQRAFIALVGEDGETSRLCQAAERELRFDLRLDQGKVTVVGDPYRYWNEGQGDAASQCAEARFIALWSLFVIFITPVVELAFRQGSQVIIARRFGFDLIRLAEKFEQNLGLLKKHERLVRKNIIDPGIVEPPLYVVTEEITEELQELLDRYFYPGSQQRYIIIPHHWSFERKVRALVNVVMTEREGHPAALAA